MKVDLETLKTMKDLLTHQHMGEVVPVHAAQPQKDSWQVFSGGLRDNWIFVVAIVGVSMWVVNGLNDQKSVNAFQEVQITSNIEDIQQNTLNIDQLNKNLNTLNQSQVSNYNELVRRMDALQSSIDSIKNTQ